MMEKPKPLEFDKDWINQVVTSDAVCGGMTRGDVICVAVSEAVRERGPGFSQRDFGRVLSLALERTRDEQATA